MVLTIGILRGEAHFGPIHFGRFGRAPCLVAAQIGQETRV